MEISVDYHNPIVLDRKAKILLKRKVLLKIYRTAYSKSGSHLKAISILRRLKKKFNEVYGSDMLTKFALVDNRYYLRMAAPGFPSPAYNNMLESEIDRIIDNSKTIAPSSVFFAITKKCLMRCEHCFEWDDLNKKEILEVSTIKEIINKFAAFGTTQFMLSGGEPMLIYDQLLQILSGVPENVDYWIITSGYDLNSDRANKLKKTGLTGVMVSIDHPNQELNEQFRGYKGAFDIAVEAIRSANNAGLVTALSLCATREFISAENLDAYMEMARSFGVAFVQVLEPRKKGRYKDRDVLLKPEHIKTLEDFFIKYTRNPDYRDFPMINYLGYHQRRTGCFGSGNRFFYIDTDGDAHLCPFCTGKQISTLTHSAEEVIRNLLSTRCKAFATSYS